MILSQEYDLCNSKQDKSRDGLKDNIGVDVHKMIFNKPILNMPRLPIDPCKLKAPIWILPHFEPFCPALCHFLRFLYGFKVLFAVYQEIGTAPEFCLTWYNRRC